MTVAPLGVSRPRLGRGREQGAGRRSHGAPAAAEERQRRAGHGRPAPGRHRGDHPPDGQGPGRHAGARRGGGAGARRVPSDRKGLPDGADQAAAGILASGRSRSTRTSGGCRSSSIARCRSRPASRPTSARWSRSLDDPLRIAYLLASLLDMKPEDKQRLLEENSISIKLDAVATRAGARDRRPRAEGTDRVARRKGDDRRAAAIRAAPADEGDPVASSARGTAKVAGTAQADRRSGPARARRGRRQSRGRSSRAHDAGGARIPDDPHLPRLAARGAVGKAHRRSPRSDRGAQASSTRTTTISTRSRSASSNTSRSAS